MIQRWSDTDAVAYVEKYQKNYGKALSLCAYATQIFGEEDDLAMHGGGNSSCKTDIALITGTLKKALFVKASGCALRGASPRDFVALDAEYLASLKTLPALSEDDMADEFSRHLLKKHASRASIETLMHAFIAAPVIMHTHPTAILALTNRPDGKDIVSDALGNDVAIIPYARVGFELATAVASAVAHNASCKAVVIMHHGLVCFGENAQEVYATTIALVTRAEEHLNRRSTIVLPTAQTADCQKARDAYRIIGPIVRGMLSPLDAESGIVPEYTILNHLVDAEILGLLSLPKSKEIFDTVPLTPDYLIRTRRLPLFVNLESTKEPEVLRAALKEGFERYAQAYKDFVAAHSSTLPEGIDFFPRVILIPGVGALCAGSDSASAAMVADITRQSLCVKAAIFQSGGEYAGLEDHHLYDMEFRALQRAKIFVARAPMAGRVALVTGSAGAIGSGICRALCEAGCHVAVTDLATDALTATASALRAEYGDRVAEIALDVTDPVSVAEGFGKAIDRFGGVDCVIVNAGIAHVSPLVSLELEAFRKLERVNIEGTLLILAQTLRHCTLQKAGGDIVLISTKNVFAPGAKFGAYSATKAASHQLARIASLEAADLGVRVNMVAPDAVFSHGEKKSGLWAAVGPDRMKARGLDEQGLEDYYRSRNLLKARIGADHVAKAVLFFVTRQTPTTGATIPVDGGLPDATPR